VRDRGAFRKQREVNDARRADEPFTGMLPSAHECREKRGCAASPGKSPVSWLTSVKYGRLRWNPLDFLDGASQNSIFRTACPRLLGTPSST
jgi:hypothetical protein